MTTWKPAKAVPTSDIVPAATTFISGGRAGSRYRSRNRNPVSNGHSVKKTDRW